MPRFIPQKVWFGLPAIFPTADGGALHVAHEEFVPTEFTFEIYEYDPDDEVDDVACRVRLIDTSGCVWESLDRWSVDAFLSDLGRFTSFSPPRFWDELPDAAKQHFEQNILVRSARGLEDGRYSAYLFLGGKQFEIPLKYQGPRLDISVSRYDNVDLVRVFCRVDGLYFRDATGKDGQMLPVFVFEASPLNQIFSTTTYEEAPGHFASDILPRPVTFARTDLSATPNPFVRYVGLLTND